MKSYTTTTNIQKGKEWIKDACRSNTSKYFRFVHCKNSGNKYTEWMTPEWALKQAKERNEYNTLSIQMRVF